MIEMMIDLEPVGSARRKELETQRDKIVERFLADQQVLSGKSAPATKIPGTVERVG